MEQREQREQREQKAQRRLHLRILTPERSLLEGSFDSLTLRSVEGELGILPGHEQGLLQLTTGLIRARDGDTVQEFLTLGGYAVVGEDEVVILSSLAETPGNMEAELARLEQRREQNLRAVQQADAELHRAETALRRALVQREVSAYALMQGNLGEQVELPREEGEEHEV